MKKYYSKKMILAVLILGLVASTVDAQLSNVVKTAYNQWFTDDVQLQFGNLPDSNLEYDTAQTPDALVLGLPVTNDRLILARKADAASDMAIADLSSGAGLTVVSNGGDKNATFSHDDTNAVIAISSGSLSVPAGIIAPIAAGSNTISTTNTNAAGASANPFDITSTLGIMNGSDDYTAIDVNITNADHTGSNTIQGFDISSITGDAQATETAINIGNGWDVGINAGNNSITTTGSISGGSLDSTGTIKTTSATGAGAHKLSGANTACNTTCSSGGCLFGFDLSAGASAPVLVECADATADTCLCLQ